MEFTASFGDGTRKRTRLHAAALAGVVGCVSLSLYVRCLCPTVYWSDSGELIASSVEPGIAHPNGSPVYTLLGHAFSRLPWYGAAWRVNLLSAVAAAVAVALAFLAAVAGVRGEREQVPVALVACIGCATALALAVAPGLWEKAVVANKYTAAAAACAGVLLVAAGRRPRPFLMGLTFAIGFGVHALTLCCAPVAAVPWAGAARGHRLRALGLTLTGMATGLAPFAYLPLRSMSDPLCDWGNPETPAGFWWLVSGQEFRGLILGAAPQEWLPNLEYIGALMLGDLGVPLILCALVATGLCIAGLARPERRDWAPIGALTMVAANVFLTATYDISNDRYMWEAYLLPSYVAAAVLAATALGAAARSARRPGRAAAWIGVAAVAVGAVWGAARNYHRCDKSPVTAAREFGLMVAGQVGRDGVLVHNASQVGFLLDYLQQVEGQGTVGAQVFLPLLSYGWYTDQLRRAHPELNVPAPSDRAGHDFVQRNEGRRLRAYPGGLGRYVSRDRLAPDGWLLAVIDDDGSALRPVPGIDVWAAATRRWRSDANTVVTYLNLAHEFAVSARERGDTGGAREWLTAAIAEGGACGVSGNGAVRQVVSLCRLTLATVLAGEDRWPEAARELAAADHLWSGRLRAEREVRWALALAKMGAGSQAVSHIRRALRHDPDNPTARRLSQSLPGRP